MNTAREPRPWQLTSIKFPINTTVMDNVTINNPIASPEPSSLTLLGLSAVGLLAQAWRKSRKRAAA